MSTSSPPPRSETTSTGRKSSTSTTSDLGRDLFQIQQLMKAYQEGMLSRRGMRRMLGLPKEGGVPILRWWTDPKTQESAYWLTDGDETYRVPKTTDKDLKTLQDFYSRAIQSGSRRYQTYHRQRIAESDNRVAAMRAASAVPVSTPTSSPSTPGTTLRNTLMSWVPSSFSTNNDSSEAENGLGSSSASPNATDGSC